MKQKHSLLSSFGFAMEGITRFFSKERNAKIQLILWLCALTLGFILNISRGEWIAVVLCGGMVLCLEMINSAIESFLDLIHPNQHLTVKRIKDLMAGAVLVMSVCAFSIALIIFTPYLLKIINP